MTSIFDQSYSQPTSIDTFQQAPKVTIFAHNPDLIKIYDSLFTTSSLMRGVSLQNQKGTYYILKKDYEPIEYELKQILKNKTEIEIISEGSFNGEWIYFNDKTNQKDVNIQKNPIQLAQAFIKSLDQTLEQVKIIFNASGTGMKINKAGHSFISLFSKKLNEILNQKDDKDNTTRIKKIVVEGRGGIVNDIDRSEVHAVNFQDFIDKIDDDKNKDLKIFLFNTICRTLVKGEKLPDSAYLKEFVLRQQETLAKKLIEGELAVAIQKAQQAFQSPNQILDPQYQIIRNPTLNAFETSQQESCFLRSTSGPLGRCSSIKKFMKFQTFDQIQRFLTKQERLLNHFPQFQDEIKMQYLKQNNPDKYKQCIDLIQKYKDFLGLKEEEIRLIPFVVQGKLIADKPQSIIQKLLKKNIIVEQKRESTLQCIEKLYKLIRSPTPQQKATWLKYRSIPKQKCDQVELKRLVAIIGQEHIQQIKQQLQKQYLNKMVQECKGLQNKQYYLTPKQKSNLKCLKELMIQKQIKQYSQNKYQFYKENILAVRQAAKNYINSLSQRSLHQGFKIADPKYGQFQNYKQQIAQYERQWPKLDRKTVPSYNKIISQYQNLKEDIIKKTYTGDLDTLNYSTMAQSQKQQLYDQGIKKFTTEANNIMLLQNKKNKFEKQWPMPQQTVIQQYQQNKEKLRLLKQLIIRKGYQAQHQKPPSPQLDLQNSSKKEYYIQRGQQQLMPNYIKYKYIQQYIQQNKGKKLTKEEKNRLQVFQKNKYQLQREMGKKGLIKLTSNQQFTCKQVTKLRNKKFTQQRLKEIKQLQMNNYNHQTNHSLLKNFKQSLVLTIDQIYRHIKPSSFKIPDNILLNKLNSIKQRLDHFKLSEINSNDINSMHYEQMHILKNLKDRLLLTPYQMNGICFGLTELFNIQRMKNEPIGTTLQKFKSLEIFSNILADRKFYYSKQLDSMSASEKQICRDYRQMKINFERIFQKIIQIQQKNTIYIYKNTQIPLQFKQINWSKQNQTDHSSFLNAMEKQKPYNLAMQYISKFGKKSYHSVGIVKRDKNRFEYFDCDTIGQGQKTMEQVEQRINHSLSNNAQKSKIVDIYSESLKLKQMKAAFYPAIDIFHNSFKAFVQNTHFQNQLINKKILGNVQQHKPCVPFSTQDLRKYVTEEKDSFSKDKQVLIIQMQGDQVCQAAAKSMMKRYNKKGELMVLDVPGLENKSYQWNQRLNQHQILPVFAKSQKYNQLNIKLIGHGDQKSLEIGGQKFTLGNKSTSQIVQTIKKVIGGKKANSLSIELVGCKSAHEEMAYKVGNHLQQFAKQLGIKQYENVQLKAYKHVIQVTQQGKATPEAKIRLFENEQTVIRLMQFKGRVFECGTSQQNQKAIDEKLNQLLKEKIISQQHYDLFKSNQRYPTFKKESPQEIFANRYHLQDKMHKMKEAVDREMLKEHNAKFRDMIPDYLSFQKVTQGYKMKMYDKIDQTKSEEIVFKKQSGVKQIEDWHLVQICQHQSFANMNKSSGLHNSLSLYYLYQGLTGLVSQIKNFDSRNVLDYVNLVTNSLQTAHGVADLVKKGLLTFEKTFTAGSKLHNVLVIGKVFPNIMRIVNPVANVINLCSLIKQFTQDGSQHGIIIAQILITMTFIILDVVEIIVGAALLFSGVVLTTSAALGPLGIILGCTMIVLGFLKQSGQQKEQILQQWKQCKRRIYEIIKSAQQKYPSQQKQDEHVNLIFGSGATITKLDFLQNTYQFGRMFIDNMEKANQITIRHSGSTFDDKSLRDCIFGTLDLYELAEIIKQQNMKIQYKQTEQQSLIIHLPVKAEEHLHQRFGGSKKPQQNLISNRGENYKQLSKEEQIQCNRCFQKIHRNSRTSGNHNYFYPGVQPIYWRPTWFFGVSQILTAHITSIQTQLKCTTIDVILGKKNTFIINPQSAEDCSRLTYCLKSSNNHYNIYLMGNLNRLTLNLQSQIKTSWTICINKPINNIAQVFRRNQDKKIINICRDGKSKEYVTVHYSSKDQITFVIHLSYSVIDKISLQLNQNNQELTVTKIIGVDQKSLYQRYKLFWLQYTGTGDNNPLEQFYTQTSILINDISKLFKLKLPLNFKVGNQFCSIQQCQDTENIFSQIPLQMNKIQALMSVFLKVSMQLNIHAKFDQKILFKVVMINFLQTESPTVENQSNFYYGSVYGIEGQEILAKNRYQFFKNVIKSFQNKKYIYLTVKCMHQNSLYSQMRALQGQYTFFIDLNYQIHYVLSQVKDNITCKHYHIFDGIYYKIKKIQIIQDNYNANLQLQDLQYYKFFKSILELQFQGSQIFYQRFRKFFTIRNYPDKVIQFQYKLLKGPILFKHYNITCELQYNHQKVFQNIQIYQRPEKQLGIVGQLYQMLDQEPYYTVNTLLDQFSLNKIPKLADNNRLLKVVVDFVNYRTILATIQLNFELQYQEIILTVFKKNKGNINIIIDEKYKLQDFTLKDKESRIQISKQSQNKQKSKISLNFNQCFQAYNCFIVLGKQRMSLNQFIKKVKLDKQSENLLIQSNKPIELPKSAPNIQNSFLLFYRIVNKSKIEKIYINAQENIHIAMSRHLGRSLQGKYITWKGRGYLDLHVRHHSLTQKDIITIPR